MSFGEEIGFADTLSEALDQVFGGDAGVDDVAPGDDAEDVPDAPIEPDDAEPTPGPTAEPTAEPTTAPPSGDARADLRAALTDARDAIAEGQRALADGDFAAYGAAQDRLAEALERAIAAETELGG